MIMKSGLNFDILKPFLASSELVQHSGKNSSRKAGLTGPIKVWIF